MLIAVPILQTFVPTPLPALAPAHLFPPPSHEASRPRPRSLARLDAIKRVERALAMLDTEKLASRGAPGYRSNMDQWVSRIRHTISITHSTMVPRLNPVH